MVEKSINYLYMFILCFFNNLVIDKTLLPTCVKDTHLFDVFDLLFSSPKACFLVSKLDSELISFYSS
jgi:hypothetical protein